MIAVAPLDAAREPAWEAFLADRPEALAYHRLPYRDLLLDVLEAEAEYLVALDDAQAVRGVLPILWSRGADERRVTNALPYYGSNGAPVSDSPEAAAALAAAWDERAGDAGTAAATLVANPLDDEPDVGHDLVDERISQITDLPDASGDVEAAIMDGIDSSARRNVRKAERLGFVVERDAGAVDALHEIHTENITRIGGRPKDRAFFAALDRHLTFGEDADLWVARDGDEVAAALLVLYGGETAEYFTPAVAHERRSDQPLALVLLHAMAHAARRGMRRWNWGGTWLSQEGVYRFKRKWGAQERRYRYLVRLGDRSLLDLEPAELLARHPDFFVVPFAALTARGGVT